MEANIKPLDGIQTSCKDCIMNVQVNNQQVGCYANQLDKFEYKELCTDPTGVYEFYVIDNAQCRFYNSNKNLNKDDVIQQTQEQLSKERFSFSAVLMLDQDCSEDQFIAFLEQLKHQSLLPECLVVCINTTNNKLKSVFLRKSLNQHLNHKWTIHYGTDLMETLHNSINKIDTLYYVLFNLDDNIPNHLFYELDMAGRVNNKKFVAVEAINNKKSFACVMTAAHKAVGGNYRAFTSPEYGVETDATFVIDKLKHVAKDQNQTSYITTYEALNINVKS